MEMWSLGTKLQSVSKKQRQAPHWRAWDQHVTQRRNVPESRDVERKGFQTTQSHFQQGRSDFRRPVYLPVCYSAVTTRWWRSACPSLRPVLSEQPHWANNRRQCLSNSLKTSFASCKTQTTTREALHTHTQSWTRQPLHWPWPMNSRVLFHLLRQHSCSRGCLAGSRLFCISAR